MTNRILISICGLGIALSVSVSCFSADVRPTVERTDSAGVTVVTSVEPTWNETTRWRVDEVPLVSISEQSGEPATQFYYVLDGTLLDDGSIVVGDAGSGELRWFDTSGQLVRVAGGMGEGPGEFEWIESVHRVEDGSILAYDSRLGRGTMFDKDGLLVKASPILVPPGLPPEDIMLSASGSIIAKRAGPSADSVSSAGKMVTTEAFYIAVDADGSSADTIAVAPGHELFLLGSSTGRPAGFRVPAFGLNEASAVYGESLYTRMGRGSQIGRYERGGELSALIRWQVPDPHLSEREIRSALVDWLGDEASAARYDLPLPETKPGFGRLLFDSDGFLWVSEYALYLRDPRRWRVFSADHELLGEVVLPPRFRVFDVRGDRILGRRLDELDREIVEILRLNR